MLEKTASDHQLYQDPGIDHIGFVVEDMEAIAKKTAEDGESGGRGQMPYRKRVYIFDGVGNEWGFIEYLSDADNKRKRL